MKLTNFRKCSWNRSPSLFLVVSLCFLQMPVTFAQAMVDEAVPPTKAMTDGSFVPGELIVKLNEGKTMEDLADLNSEFNIVSSDRLFQHLEASSGDIGKMKKKLKELNGFHESWYWQFDKNSKEYKDYLARLEQQKKILEAEIQKAEQRQQISDKAIQNNRLEDIYKLEVAEKTTDILAMARTYSAHPAVKYAEPNYEVKVNFEPNDQYWTSSGSWGQPYDDLWGLKKIKANLAWDKSKGEGIIVAVIDTGVDYNHEDIKDNMWINPADGTYGFNFTASGERAYLIRDPMDDHGHGTHCAGTIAAIQNNGVGITGVAPRARIMAIKGLNREGSGSASNLSESVIQAVQSGADVLSNSWGGSGRSDVFEDVFRTAQQSGVVSVVAAGNDNVDALDFHPAYLPSVITVAASNPDDVRCSFSNYGAKADVSAPGGDSAGTNDGDNFWGRNILSLRSDNKGDPTDMYYQPPGAHEQQVVGGKYYRARGTSMACPHVAGVVALILSEHLDFLNKDLNLGSQTGKVLSILKATGEPVSESNPLKFVGPRVNAYAALQVTQELPVGILKSIDGEQSPLPLVRGIAGGANFLRYAVYYAHAEDPTSWNLVTESSIPVLDDLATADPDDGILSDALTVDKTGSYLVRLIVYSVDGKQVISQVSFTIPNAITAPLSNDFISRNTTAAIKADLKGVYQDYVVEWGEGKTPLEWRIAGITRLHPGPGADFSGDIALWNTALVPSSSYANGSFYTIRVGIQKSGGWVYSYKNLIYLDAVMKPGWPQYIRPAWWDLKAEDQERFKQGDTTDVTAADLDGDGQKEIIVCVAKVRDEQQGSLSVYNSDGSLRWSITVEDLQYTVPVIGDINDDGKQEIFLANSSTEDKLYGFKYDGGVFPGFPVSLERSSFFMMADLKSPGNAGKRLIGISKFSYSGEGKTAVILKKDGSVQKKFKFTKGSNLSEVIRSQIPAVGNFDNDPELEIVAVQANGVQAFNPNGTLCAGWPSSANQMPEGYDIYGCPAVGDIDGDGYDNVVVAAFKTRRVSATGGFKILNEDLAVFAFDKNGGIMPGWPVLMNQLSDLMTKMPYSRYQSPALADFNGDGKLEIAFGVGPFHYLFDYRGNVLPGWPRSVPAPSIHHVQMAIGDVDGDGTPDLISSAGGLQKEIFTEESLSTTGGIFAWKFDGTPIDLNPDPSMDFLPTEFESKPPLTLSDIDADGKINIVASTTQDFVFAEHQVAPVSKQRRSINVWGLNTAYDASTMQWPMYQHDTMRTGRYVSSVEVTPDPNPDPTPVPTSKPAKPSSLGATAVSVSQINLAWADNANNETGFKIYRSLTDSNYVEVATASANAVSFSDLNLNADTRYYYKVSAVNAAGESAKSSKADARTNAVPQPPAKPSNLGATAVSASQINLAWADNASNETGFKIYRSLTDSNYAEVATAPANAVSFSDGGLNSGTRYYYKVSAFNAAGESAFSSQVSAVTMSVTDPAPAPDQVPAKPDNLGAQQISSSRIRLTWTDRSSNETGFKIYRSISHRAQDSILVATVSANVTHYTDTGLDRGHRYGYRVSAVNGSGESEKAGPVYERL